VQACLFILLVVAVLFVLTALDTGDWNFSWEVLSGSKGPFSHDSLLAILLSAAGYLAVPAVIGLLAADLATRYLLHGGISDAVFQRSIEHDLKKGPKHK